MHLLVVCSSPALPDQLKTSWQGEGSRPVFAEAAGLAPLRAKLREQHWDAVLHCLNHAACTPAATLKTLRDRNLDLIRNYRAELEGPAKTSFPHA